MNSKIMDTEQCTGSSPQPIEQEYSLLLYLYYWLNQRKLWKGTDKNLQPRVSSKENYRWQWADASEAKRSTSAQLKKFPLGCTTDGIFLGHPPCYLDFFSSSMLVYTRKLCVHEVEYYHTFYNSILHNVQQRMNE